MKIGALARKTGTTAETLLRTDRIAGGTTTDRRQLPGLWPDRIGQIAVYPPRTRPRLHHGGGAPIAFFVG